MGYHTYGHSHKGFFYHLLRIDTGQPDTNTELSTIDTALLMAGVLFTRQYYTGTSATETAIRQRAGQLFNRVDWAWAVRTNPSPAINRNQFYMAWKPVLTDDYKIPAAGGGYFSGIPSDPGTWDYYTDEILLINLLAIGSPTHPVLTNTFSAWQRQLGSYNGYTLYQSWNGSLFTYFIGQGWLNLRAVAEQNTSIIWWENSKKAVLAQRQFVIDQSANYATYGPQSWGLSANLGPPTLPLTKTLAGVGVYTAYGGLPKIEFGAAHHDGTIAPYAAAGSIIFLDPISTSNPAYQALKAWYQTQPRLWGLYGFRDGFNLGKSNLPKDDWFAHDYFGLDQGMTLLALENYRTGFIWRTIGRDPVIFPALCAVFKCYHSYLPIILKN